MSVIADVLYYVFVFLILFFAVLGLTGFILALIDPSESERRRLEERTRRAEREISEIGLWEQQAIMTELLRRETEGRPDNRPSTPPPVIDGEWEEQ